MQGLYCLSVPAALHHWLEDGPQKLGTVSGATLLLVQVLVLDPCWSQARSGRPHLLSPWLDLAAVSAPMIVHSQQARQSLVQVDAAQLHGLAVVPQDLGNRIHEGLILSKLDTGHIEAARQGHRY